MNKKFLLHLNWHAYQMKNNSCLLRRLQFYHNFCQLPYICTYVKRQQGLCQNWSTWYIWLIPNTNRGRRRKEEGTAWNTCIVVVDSSHTDAGMVGGPFYPLLCYSVYVLPAMQLPLWPCLHKEIMLRIRYFAHRLKCWLSSSTYNLLCNNASEPTDQDPCTYVTYQSHSMYQNFSISPSSPMMKIYKLWLKILDLLIQI